MIAKIKSINQICVSESMAVPKKRRSKSKGRTRLSNWKRKCFEVAKKAFGRGVGKSKNENKSAKDDNIMDNKIDNKLIDSPQQEDKSMETND